MSGRPSGNQISRGATTAEPDGAPTSLCSGRIDPREMGSRVQRVAPKDIEKKKEKTGDAGKHETLEKTATTKRRVEAEFGFTDIIEAAQDGRD
ncbi:hypothetical protein BU15DRAFT_74549 [Melanogaster broomeanus]|nr:hypothetical protein BU15DRAFT_74549 [Melanogaster broomeanus]